MRHRARVGRRPWQLRGTEACHGIDGGLSALFACTIAARTRAHDHSRGPIPPVCLLAARQFTQAGELQLGDLNAFNAGIQGVVGLPHPKLRETMEKEHCDSPDSNEEFYTTNCARTHARARHGSRIMMRVRTWPEDARLCETDTERESAKCEPRRGKCACARGTTQ